ncbi:hypothetical protein Tco_0141990 [Tanacetum coccineum]
MSASDKFRLGYGDYRYSGILSYENKVSQSVFKCNKSDSEMQAVPPPMIGNYLPSGPDIEIDDSQYTYGPRKSQPNESESQTTELDTCDSNTSTETSELVSEPVVNESNIEVQPKVWSDAPIIEEYESDSDDESEAIRNRPPTKNQLRNQMMTYLKHVGNFKHSKLKSKKFEEIQAMYEKIKRSEEDFIAIGSVEDDRLIKKMKKKDSSKGEEIKQFLVKINQIR